MSDRCKQMRMNEEWRNVRRCLFIVSLRDPAAFSGSGTHTHNFLVNMNIHWKDCCSDNLPFRLTNKNLNLQHFNGSSHRLFLEFVGEPNCIWQRVAWEWCQDTPTHTWTFLPGGGSINEHLILFDKYLSQGCSFSWWENSTLNTKELSFYFVGDSNIS